MGAYLGRGAAGPDALLGVSDGPSVGVSGPGQGLGLVVPVLGRLRSLRASLLWW